MDTGGATLDLSQELVGQAVSFGSWGTFGAGDFNLFSSESGPQGVSPFVLGTDGLGGDEMTLTSFRPLAIPEPASVGLIGLSALALFFIRRIFY